MARYYEETALIEFVKQYTPHINGETTMECVERAIREAPTADVVPKSKVDRLQEEANRYKRYYFRHDYDEMIAEVLDKLDRFINANCIAIKDERGIKGYVTSGVHFAIAEHKKKYTE